MKRTSTGRVSICLSWVIFFSGITVGLYFWCSNSLKTGTIILVAGAVVAVILRLLANINEFLFNLSQSVRLIGNQFKDGFSLVNQNTREINCDSRDINQNLHKLSSFLEEIQKYLHLKK